MQAPISGEAARLGPAGQVQAMITHEPDSAAALRLAGQPGRLPLRTGAKNRSPMQAPHHRESQDG